ncbi:MAG: class I mannose-6-phosphate isomerase [Chloroflexi bacterium]|nr:class I mannose-6-phosphate isomerase [Chloroflexota bacterium]
MTNIPNYPLRFRPLLKEKVWGGHALEPLVGEACTERHIGEAWLIHESLPVQNGPLQGRTLAEVVRDFPQEMLGVHGAGFVVDGVARFPLLAKFLDAEDWLSVQLHPNDGQARAREGVPYGKCEFWYVLDAAPGARVIHGLTQKLRPDELIRAARTGAIRDMFDTVAVSADDVLINTHGMIHALGPGLRIYELQQSSDITYRLYDWDRPASDGRELHLEQSAAIADYEPVLAHTITPIEYSSSNGTETRMLAACRYFAATLKRITDIDTSNTRSASPHLLTVLSGAGAIQVRDERLELRAGDSILVPAHVGEYTLFAADELRIITGFVPDLAKDIVRPLHAIGCSAAQIKQLGGDGTRSDLVGIA